MLRPLHHVSRRFVQRASTATILNRLYTTSLKPSLSVAQLSKLDEKCSNYPDQSTVALDGFVRSVRKQKRVAFAAIGDGTCADSVQAVLTPEQAKELSTGAAVRVTGRWQKSPSGKEQSHELVASTVDILGDHDAERFPLQKKFQSNEFLRTIPHLRARIPFNTLILRLRSEAIRHATEYFARNGYIQTHPPVITSSDCEGAGEVFGVDGSTTSRNIANPLPGDNSGSRAFFRSPKYLTVSSQLHLEALAQAAGKVWTLAPTFRAEHSDTPRHLSEFYMLEAEACFLNDVDQVMDVVEGLLKAIVAGLESSAVGLELRSMAQKPQEHSDAIAVNIEARWAGMLSKAWPRITYTDAITMLQRACEMQSAHFNTAPQLGQDLQAEHEKYLAEQIGRGSPVFVTDYPREIKAFYMAPSVVQQCSAMPTVACFDLLVPELCEIAGGSMREHRLKNLLEAMKDHGLLQAPMLDIHSGDLEAAVPLAMQWYVDLRRFGSVPHGGFGLGFDRLLCYLSGISSIRDSVSFPRWYGRCDC